MYPAWWPTAHQGAGTISELQCLVGASSSIGASKGAGLIRRNQASVCDEVIVVRLGAESHGISKAPARKRVPVRVIGQPPGEHGEFSGRLGEGAASSGIEYTGLKPLQGVRQLVNGETDQLCTACALILLTERIDIGQQPFGITHADSVGAVRDKHRDRAYRG